VRGECYRLLAACFYPPQRDVWLEENLAGNLADLLDQACPAAAAPCRRMHEALAATTREDLAVEHARLFLGPQHVPAPPYGSVYLDDGQRVMGDSTLAVLRAYRDAGLRLDPELKELPDHIAVELEFLYYLTSRGVEVRQAGGDPQEANRFFAARQAFLDTHLRRWVPAFSVSVKAGTESEFYRSLADCLAAFIGVHPEAGGACRDSRGGLASRQASE